MRLPWIWPDAAYVHVPFCAHHCGYCDFAVAVGRDDQIDRYLKALETELSGLRKSQPVRTMHLGGGTPTYLAAGQLGRMLDIVLAWLPLQSGHEFAVEANPAGLDREKLDILAEHGVNRLSLGAQSFHPDSLRVLERDHDPADVFHVWEMARPKFASLSLDLIFGVPGQSLERWRDDLRQALALEPDHLSTYGLTFEKGTRLWKQRRDGQVTSMGEDDELAQYTLAMDVLQEAGFEHYEISNFARPGQRSRHNQVYWANHAYWGFGMGAARYVEGVREVNARDLNVYLDKALRGENPAFQSEKLDAEERALETIGLQLRRCDGILRAEFLSQTGFDLDAIRGDAIRRLVDVGVLEDTGDAVRLTRRGRCVADAVISNLV